MTIPRPATDTSDDSGEPLLRPDCQDPRGDHQRQSSDGLRRMVPRLQQHRPVAVHDENRRLGRDQHDERERDVRRQRAALDGTRHHDGESIDLASDEVVDVGGGQRKQAPTAIPFEPPRHPEHTDAHGERGGGQGERRLEPVPEREMNAVPALSRVGVRAEHRIEHRDRDAAGGGEHREQQRAGDEVGGGSGHGVRARTLPSSSRLVQNAPHTKRSPYAAVSAEPSTIPPERHRAPHAARERLVEHRRQSRLLRHEPEQRRQRLPHRRARTRSRSRREWAPVCPHR